MRIVVSDDEARVRAGIISTIREVAQDAQIVGQATTVEETAALVRLHDPDVVLLDVRMPGGTGFDAVTTVAEGTSTRSDSFPIWIVVSSYSEFDYAQQALKLNVFDYLLKPVAPDEMREILDKARIEIIRRRNRNSGAREMRETSDPAGKARVLMDNHFEKPLGVDQIAEQVGVTANYLSTVFRERYGQPPLRYLMSVRMDRAAQLLKQGYKVTEVAPMVGYRDTRHFSRLFTRYHGEKPSVLSRKP